AFPARVPHDETGNPPDDASLEGLARPIRTSITKSRQWGTLAALIVTAMVTYEVDGRVAVITIRRPEARNAVNGEVANGIESAIDRLEDDPDVWVGVLTGEGTVFSAGADLKVIAAGGMRDLVTAR